MPEGKSPGRVPGEPNPRHCSAQIRLVFSKCVPAHTVLGDGNPELTSSTNTGVGISRFTAVL